jgi:hypothetical protein
VSFSTFKRKFQEFKNEKLEQKYIKEKRERLKWQKQLKDIQLK